MATDSAASPAVQTADQPRGFAYALTVYCMWGFLPLYFKALAHISPFEVLAHRVVWSVPIAALILLITGRTGDLKTALRSPRTLVMAAVTATLITVNWCTYVYAVGSGQTVEGALGYFINPLFSIMLGAMLLNERLATTQKVAIALAFVAVAILTFEAGRLPWISLTLTFSWGFYALLRKTLPVGPNQGFFLEVAILSVPAVPYIVYLEATGTGHLLNGTTSDVWLLAAAGITTAVPLMIYGNAAKLLRLSTIGIMQYITPSIVFLIAVFIFHEPMNPIKLSAFALIWTALALYSWSMLKNYRSR